MPSTIGRATIGTSQVAATAVTGWSSSTPCGGGILVSLPVANTGVTWYRFATGPNDTTVAMPIPNGVPYTINPVGMAGSLSNLFFVADTAGQVFAAEAIG